MIEPTREQAQDLKAIQEFERLETLPAWTILKTEMQQMVEEAHDDMVGLVAPSPEVSQSMLIRYQQRRAMKLAIEQIVADHLATKKQILEQLAEPSGEKEDGNESANY